MIWYFYQTQNKITEKKGKIKQKIKKQETYLSPGARPSRPSPPGPACRLPQAGTLVRVGHAEGAAVPGHLLLPPCHISTPGDAQELPHSIPPSSSSSPSPLACFVDARGERRSA